MALTGLVWKEAGRTGQIATDGTQAFGLIKVKCDAEVARMKADTERAQDRGSWGMRISLQGWSYRFNIFVTIAQV